MSQPSLRSRAAGKWRQRAVLEAPTPESWSDAYGIVRRSEPELTLTLWGAVKAVDPNFPGTKLAGHGGWECVPDQVERALRYAREAVPSSPLARRVTVRDQDDV